MLIKILIGLLILILIFAVGVIAYDSNRFVVRKYSYETDKVSKNLRIVFLSDLHNKCYGKDNEKLIKSIKALNGDIILLGGDMMTAKKKAEFDQGISFISRISEIAPYIYAFGNHESRARFNKNNRYGTLFADYARELLKIGVSIKDNECVDVDGIKVYCLTIPESFYNKRKLTVMQADDITGCIGKPDQDSLNVLLAHNPEHFDGCAAWGADVVLAGHYHGGIVRLPFSGKGVISPRFTLFPKYDGGVYKSGETTMYVSRGLGMHTIPLRMFNPSEILVLDIKRP